MSNHGQNEFQSNEVLVARRNDACPKGLPSKSGIYAERAQGAEIWDVEGNRYIDFIAGIGVLNVGHRHPKVQEAIKAQLDKVVHTCFGVAQYESYIELAERLNKLVANGRSTPYKTMFMNTGSEATEHVCKFARRITGRTGLISFEGSFHGRTLLATALTGKAVPYKVGFGPLPGDVFHAPYPDPYKGMSSEGALNCLKHIMQTSIRPEDVAAIIIEPVQGEGGFVPAPKEFLQGLRKLCDEHGILFIADEVQTGFARTGKMFAIENSGVEPDFLVCAKSIAGGLPLSAVIGKQELFDKIEPGGMGSTYGGNPVACAAALAVLDVIEEEGLIARAEEIGAKLEARWKDMQAGIAKGLFGDVRRVGAMAAVECVVDGDPNQPNAEMAAAIQGKCRDNGLIFLTAGKKAQVIRTHVPLVASDELIDEGLDIFEKSVRQVLEG
ncbi:4-aminobutyrate--2-oxoglutarate transaminase [Parvularcula flava]|uniref:4-aminobutyrate transaminase n=1 Tax=Aquisalinus luteolus TaxID=1566827 RepID=A0A8J3EQ60_9PROT|nr:4-aminobutyrate--2-oxoglutarate transaminase [Aquisalinus luteolus]NHK29358.1 4-aminobutyrate--2-oxoglutarate transaminase [Aquisalinus luteolus]GGI01022.1 4-aminobutyrate transaminase [Aquisalinus luteolus]